MFRKLFIQLLLITALKTTLLASALVNTTPEQGNTLQQPSYASDTPSVTSEVVHLLACEQQDYTIRLIEDFDSPAIKVLHQSDSNVIVLVPSIWMNALPFDSCDCTTQQSFSLYFLADAPERASASTSSPGAGGTRTTSPFIRMLMEQVAAVHFSNLVPIESARMLLIPEVDTSMPEEFQFAQITF